MAAVTNESGETWEARVLQAGLTCPICMEFLSEPLSLDCGHAFCRLCLLQSSKLAPDGRHCPNCRRPISIRDPVSHPADASLVLKVSQLVPASEISARSEENAKNLKMLLEQEKNSIPVFYMRGVASRIDEDVFLHFFEPRYKVLIRRAWEGNKRFICTQTKPADGDRGLLVEVSSAKFRSDGKADIQGRGIDIVELRHVRVDRDSGGLYYADVGEVSPDLRNRGATSRMPSRGTSQTGVHDQNSAAQVQVILRQAIQEGAPRYNRGDHAGCHAVYLETAERCLALLAESTESTGEQMATLLRCGIRDASALERDHNAAAWALRRVFDAVLAMSPPQHTSGQRANRSGSSGQGGSVRIDGELPVFYLSPGVPVGRTVGVNFFEPRYKRLASSVWDSPERFFLYSSAVPSPDSMSTIVRMDLCEWDGQGNALIRGMAIDRVHIEAVRTEDDGLYYARYRDLATNARRTSRIETDSVASKCHCVVQ